MASQLDDEARRRSADVVVSNDGTLANLRETLSRLWSERIAPAAPQSRNGPV
jgi:dephospho-CoA kinase